MKKLLIEAYAYSLSRVKDKMLSPKGATIIKSISSAKRSVKRSLRK